MLNYIFVRLTSLNILGIINKICLEHKPPDKNYFNVEFCSKNFEQKFC